MHRRARLPSFASLRLSSALFVLLQAPNMGDGCADDDFGDDGCPDTPLDCSVDCEPGEQTCGDNSTLVCEADACGVGEWAVERQCDAGCDTDEEGEPFCRD